MEGRVSVTITSFAYWRSKDPLADLKGRENAHNNGRGSKYTFLRRPVQLVYSESYDSLEKAIGRERQLKRWSRTKKKALIVGDAARLKQLSKRRS
ncbi:MAG: GIY-YIG nuclease family protein [Candidatus Methylomirabilales bacterium]